NKLRAGHLRGNRFRILIRDVAPVAAELLPSLLDLLRQNGLPNFYGPQRFGRDGETAQLGMALLTGTAPARRRSPFLTKLALSASQSFRFNSGLARRLDDGLLRRVLPGDVMAKLTGGLFVAEDLPREQARFDARETVFTGPIFGRKTFAAQ